MTMFIKDVFGKYRDSKRVTSLYVNDIGSGQGRLTADFEDGTSSQIRGTEPIADAQSALEQLVALLGTVDVTAL